MDSHVNQVSEIINFDKAIIHYCDEESMWIGWNDLNVMVKDCCVLNRTGFNTECDTNNGIAIVTLET